MSKTFTAADVAKHDQKAKEMYLIVDSAVYDVTNFVDEHPGGAKILKRVAGKDASKQFWKVRLVEALVEVEVEVDLPFCSSRNQTNPGTFDSITMNQY